MSRISKWRWVEAGGLNRREKREGDTCRRKSGNQRYREVDQTIAADKRQLQLLETTLLL